MTLSSLQQLYFYGGGGGVEETLCIHYFIAKEKDVFCR